VSCCLQIGHGLVITYVITPASFLAVAVVQVLCTSHTRRDVAFDRLFFKTGSGSRNAGIADL
jgi:hypothetical protein